MGTIRVTTVALRTERPFGQTFATTAAATIITALNTGAIRLAAEAFETHPAGAQRVFRAQGQRFPAIKKLALRRIQGRVAVQSLALRTVAVSHAVWTGNTFNFGDIGFRGITGVGSIHHIGEFDIGFNPVILSRIRGIRWIRDICRIRSIPGIELVNVLANFICIRIRVRLTDVPKPAVVCFQPGVPG